MMVKIVGLIPAAGYATRLGAQTCSKEILSLRSDESGQPTLVCDALLRAMSLAGVERVYWIIRDGKYDISSRLGDGSGYDLPFAYIVTGDTAGTPFTLDCAYPFVDDATVVTGFPDIDFSPTGAVAALLKHHSSADADITLGVFRTDSPEKMDVVLADSDGRVRGLRIKQPADGNNMAWILAAWSPLFTKFMHDYLADQPKCGSSEIYVGSVIVAALEAGLVADAFEIPDGECTDIGTPDDLAKIRRRFK